MRPYMETEAIAVAAPCESESATALTVETVNNHVYFYSGVDSDRCLALIKAVRSVDEMLRNERITRNVPTGVGETPIWLHIMSGGGDLFSALSVADQLKTLATPVYSIVEGFSASAATIISMACSRRFIMPSAFFMIHQLSSFYWGKYSELQDDMHILDMLMDTVARFYVSRSSVTEKRIRKLLKRDSWFSAKEALELGFVDDIMGEL